MLGVSAGLAALGILSFAIASAGLAVLDLRAGRLPNRVVLPALAVTASLCATAIVTHAIATGSWSGPDTLETLDTPAVPETAQPAASWPTPRSALPWLAETLGGALACFAGDLGLWLAAPGKLGGGDVKAAPLAGLALGFALGWAGVLWGVLLGAAIAALWGLAARALRAAGGAGDRPAGATAIPFAPALFGGAWIVLVIDAAHAAATGGG